MSTSRMLSGLNQPGPVTRNRPGELTAIRTDGKVNVRFEGSIILGAVCLNGYTPTVGDRVNIIYSDGMWVVVNKYAINPVSAFSNTVRSFALYNAANGNSYTLGRPGLVNNVGPQQTGYTNVDPDLTPLILAWSYWNGANNNLNDLATVGISTITMKFFRSADDGGKDDYAAIRLFPHASNALPVNGFTYFSTQYSSFQIPIQRGQALTVNLPSDWVTAIKAGTIKGICAVPPVSAAEYLNSYARFDTGTGSFVVS